LDHKRLEDRIQALLAKTVDTADAEELESVISDLRSALNQHGQAAERNGGLQNGPAPARHRFTLNGDL